MDEFLKVLNDDPKEYKVVINDKKKGLLCEQRTYTRTYPMIRCTVKYDYPALLIWRASTNNQMHPIYDANCDL